LSWVFRKYETKTLIFIKFSVLSKKNVKIDTEEKKEISTGIINYRKIKKVIEFSLSFFMNSFSGVQLVESHHQKFL